MQTPTSPTAASKNTTSDLSPETAYRQERLAHWDQVAQETEKGIRWESYYHRRLNQIYQFLVAPDQKVLEIGCGQGDLLAALRPAKGVGIDFSTEMIKKAQQRHPDLDFIAMDAHNLDAIQETFDVIVLSDLVNDLWDVQAVFEQIAPLCHEHTRVILNFYSRLWELPLAIAEKLGMAKPTLFQNWLTPEDATNLLHLSGFDVIRSWPEILWPLRTPLLDSFLNKFLVKLWPFKAFAITNFIVARPQPRPATTKQEPSVSVVIAARNEAGNIPAIFKRVPQMGSQTEIVFVEGHSTDETYAVIQEAIQANPDWPCQLHKQTGKGKGDAIRLGFEKATGDILMILDADLTVPPEDLPRFYEALVSNRGEFINGVRLVYPMEDQAMRFFNLLGNKFFSLTFSWLLGQPVKDTLCGTKVLWKQDYERIAANRAYFGDFDPFGDFDLLFGAAKMGLKIVDLPIRYRQRVYGDTNIDRWKHGWLLLKMSANAARKLKFV
jgi:SAM-dependent methyltransferase